MRWHGPCADIKYQITPSGSMA